MRSIKFAAVAVVVSSFYLAIPYSVGKRCLGMECLGYMIAAAPVVAVGLPWSKLVWDIPVPEEVSSSGISRGAMLQRGNWPRIAGYIFCYFLNVFIVFGLGHFFVRKLRNKRRSRLGLP